MFQNVSDSVGKTLYNDLRTERIKLFVGTLCNENCEFCYYTDYVKINTNSSLTFLKKQLKWARSMGAKDVDFSGGEPTIHKDLPDLINYTKELGFRNIAVISNGIRTADPKFFMKLVDSGLNDILLSVHGSTSTIHDQLTRFPGSFNKMLLTLQNAKDSGIKLRTNTVITAKNYNDILNTTNLLFKYEPYAMNYLMFNDWWSPNEQVNLMPDFELTSKFIKQSIDQIKYVVPKITVRYMPLCYMEGYEKYICDFPQINYDDDEWNLAIQTFLADYGFVVPKNTVYGFVKMARGLAKFLKTIGGYPGVDFLLKHKKILMKFIPSEKISDENFKEPYFKTKECSGCSLNNLCDGIKTEYDKLYPDYRIYPRAGKPIIDPMYFRGPYLRTLRSEKDETNIGKKGGTSILQSYSSTRE